MKVHFTYRVSLSGVCQPADADAVGSADASPPAGNTDVSGVTVTRGQNFTHPRKTTVLSKPQQTQKGLRSISSPSFSHFSSHLVSFNSFLSCFSLHVSSCLYFFLHFLSLLCSSPFSFVLSFRISPHLILFLHISFLVSSLLSCFL